MYTEIIYQGERCIVHTSALDGYEGHEVIAVHDSLPDDDQVGQLSNEHLLQMHAMKSLEASMILSGVKMKAGILFEEANATGQDLDELAQIVSDKTNQQRALEVERRKRKIKEKGNDDDTV